MSPLPYTEDQLVERPAIGLFAEIGWRQKSASRSTLKLAIEDTLHLRQDER